jgi:hypothetical protein
MTHHRPVILTIAVLLASAGSFSALHTSTAPPVRAVIASPVAQAVQPVQSAQVHAMTAASFHAVSVGF